MYEYVRTANIVNRIDRKILRSVNAYQSLAYSEPCNTFKNNKEN